MRFTDPHTPDSAAKAKTLASSVAPVRAGAEGGKSLSSKSFPRDSGGLLHSRPVAKKVPAWAMSMLLHLALVIALVFLAQPRGGAPGPQGDRPVGIAVAHRMADRTLYEEVTSEETTTAGDEATANAAPSLPAAAAPPAIAQPLDFEGLLADVTQTPSPDAGIGSSTALQAAGGGAGGTGKIPGEIGGAKATTMFFGVSGSGRKFVYVFDRSDSMNGNDALPLRAAKRELVRSLGLLTEDQSFQIIFYNNRPSYFEPQGESFWLLSATDSMKRRAEVFVRAIEGFGGTEHFDALKMALKLEPDVIFFLTDARIPRLGRRQLDEVRARCLHGGTTIHAIEFGTDLSAPEDSFLRVLASENAGEYRYFNVQRLPNSPAEVTP